MRLQQILLLFSLLVGFTTAFVIGVVDSWVRRFAITTVTGGEPLIVKPPGAAQRTNVDVDETAVATDTALILLPGCLLKPQQYASLAESIQSHSQHSNVWLAVPKVPFDVVNPLTVESAFHMGQEALREAGFRGDSIFLGGHSLGSAFLHTMDLPENVAGLVFVGGFPPRTDGNDKNSNKENTKIPSLTISGDLDGLVRVSRIAESYHASITSEKAKLQHPVVLIEGMNHFGFIEGIVHPMKEFRDLEPEISSADAIEAVASTIAEFIDCHHARQTAEDAPKVAKKSLVAKVTKTGEYLAPLLHAMSLEGSYHLETPCHLCEDDDDMQECSLDCVQGSPWTEQFQHALASTVPGFSDYTVDDEFRQSWWFDLSADKPFFHPEILANSDANGKQQFSMQTFTEAVYEKTEQFLDTGFFSNTALELRSKFNSPQAIEHAMGSKPQESLQDENTCSKMNAQTIQWALQNAPPIVRQRYLEKGAKMVAGRDIPKHSGPAWIWSYLDIKDESCNSESDEDEDFCRIVDSPTMVTPVDHPIVGGKLYCKLLSPARVLDWMYTDSLRYREATGSGSWSRCPVRSNPPIQQHQRFLKW